MTLVSSQCRFCESSLQRDSLDYAGFKFCGVTCLEKYKLQEKSRREDRVFDNLINEEEDYYDRVERRLSEKDIEDSDT